METQADTTAAIEKLKLENAQLKAKIEEHTANKLGAEKTAGAAAASSTTEGCVKALHFTMVGARAEFAGVNNGSNFRPPQTKRRTNMGGFFTS